jgi:type VI secretion system protein ImpC
MSAKPIPKLPQARAAAAASSLLDDIVEEQGRQILVRACRAKDLISELVSQVMDGTVVVSDNLSATSTPASPNWTA